MTATDSEARGRGVTVAAVTVPYSDHHDDSVQCQCHWHGSDTVTGSAGARRAAARLFRPNFRAQIFKLIVNH